MRAAIVALMLGWMALAEAADVPQFFPGIDSFHAQAYGQQLQALREESLCCGAAGQGRVLRFVWLRSFHHPVVIRLNELPDGNWRVTTKIGSGAGGYKPGAGFTQDGRTVTTAQARAVTSLFGSESPFWSTASGEPATTAEPCPSEPGKECLSVHVDGAQWLIEARDRDRYHYVDRWSPAGGATRTMGERFMALSGQDFGKIY